MSELVASAIALMLVAIGFALPHGWRVAATLFGLVASVTAYAAAVRDGGWTFIHNDVGVMLLAVVASCIGVGALIRFGALLVANLMHGRANAHG